jgi:predicted DNA-binding transcriptional regulator YafY
MTRTKKPADADSVVTPQRAARLFRLLSLLGNGSQTRVSLLKRLNLDLRGFYRDLEFLRSLGVEYSSGNHRYCLACDLESALARLPFPDPCLSLKDAMQLSRGSSEAHRKLRKRIESVTGHAGRNHVL